MELLPMWKTLSRAISKRPATLKAPQPAAITRGHVENSIPNCIFCGICQKRCPTGAIIVNRNKRTWAIAQFDCMQCRCCVDVCPKKCLSMSNRPPDAVNEQAWRVERGEEPDA